MGNKIIEAGFGNLLSFISSNTSIGPTIKNFAELNEKPQYVKTTGMPVNMMRIILLPEDNTRSYTWSI